jgi:acetyl esterase/lipase
MAIPATSTHLPSRPGRGPLLVSAAAFSLGGAAVYLAVLPALLQTSLVYGIGFAAAGIAQVVLAAALLLTGPTRRRLVAALAVSLVVLAVWGLAHTTGLPGPNPWLPLDTAIGITDYLCAALEALAALLLAVAVARWPRAPRVRRPVLVVLASIPSLLLAALLSFGGVAFATDGFTTVTRAGGPLPASPVPGGRTTVTYCTQHGTDLAMDLYQPPTAAARPAPVALYVHGGGFVLGDRKTSGLGASLGRGQAGALFEPLRAALNQRGFVVASIDYLLAPLGRWPAQVEDAKCAVRFLRAHASTLGIDPGRIGAWGSSAGGNLVSLLGLAGPQAGFDHGPYADQSSSVQAVVDMFGVGTSPTSATWTRSCAWPSGSPWAARPPTAAPPARSATSAPSRGPGAHATTRRSCCCTAPTTARGTPRCWSGGCRRPGSRSGWCWSRVPRTLWTPRRSGRPPPSSPIWSPTSSSRRSRNSGT